MGKMDLVSSGAGAPCNDVSLPNRAGCGEWGQQSDGSRPNPPKWGIILSLRWVILREIKRSDAMGKMVVVVVVVVVGVGVGVVVVELIFLNNNHCWQP